MADGVPAPYTPDSLSAVNWVLFNNLKRLSDSISQNSQRLRHLEDSITKLIAKVEQLQPLTPYTPAQPYQAPSIGATPSPFATRYAQETKPYDPWYPKESAQAPIPKSPWQHDENAKLAPLFTPKTDLGGKYWGRYDGEDGAGFKPCS